MRVSNDKNGREAQERPWWHKYIDEHAARDVAVIRDKGMPVWSLIGHYRLYQGDGERMLDAWQGELTTEELEAALAYYWSKPYAIDEKLGETYGESTGTYAYGKLDNAPLMQQSEQPWRKYIDEETRSVALIRDKGWSVWSLVRYYRIHGGDKARLLNAYHGDLTAEELDAALSYYWANPSLIDEKLKALSS